MTIDIVNLLSIISKRINLKSRGIGEVLIEKSLICKNMRKQSFLGPTIILTSKLEIRDG
jgi:hypothetical protein